MGLSMIPLLPALISTLAGVAGGVGAGYAERKQQEEEGRQKEAGVLIKRAEALAEKGDWETYEQIIPNLMQLGASQNVIDAGRKIAQSHAAQIFEQELASGLPPSVKPPPSYLAQLLASQGTGEAASASKEDLLSQIHGTDTAISSFTPGSEARGAAIDQQLALTKQLPTAQPATPVETSPPLQTGIQFPPHRPPASRSTQAPTSTVTTSYPGLTSKEAIAAALSQARQQRMPPRQVRIAIDAENARRQAAGQPILNPNDPALKAYDDEHFETVKNEIEDELRKGRGMDPATAFQQAADMAYQQTGHVPAQWMDVVKPKREELTSHAYINAVNRAGESLPKQMEILRQATSPEAMKNAISPGFLSRLIDLEPNLTSTDSTRAKVEAAKALSQRLMPQLHAQFPDRTSMQLAAMAMQLAAYAVDGNVPEEWYAAVAGNPVAFGFGNEQSAIMTALKINPFDADAGRRAQDAQIDLEKDKEFRQALLAKLQTPEGVQAAMKQDATPGPTDRETILTHKGTIDEQYKVTERKHTVAPPTLVKDLKVIDDLHRTSIQLQQFVSKKDAQGLTFLDKYGDVPSFVFSSMKTIQQYFGSAPADVATYAAIMGKSFNIEKKEITGTASMSRERKDLMTFMPSADENVRSAMQKMVELYKSTSVELERDLSIAERDYPATDWGQFYHRKVKARRAAEKKAKETK